MWEAAVEAAAELDALMSLAAVAEMGSSQGPMCRPKLLEHSDEQQVRTVSRRRAMQENPGCFLSDVLSRWDMAQLEYELADLAN
jgi:hypothetical protein